MPSDIVEDFLTECDKTLAGNNDIPLKERVAKMVTAFEGLGVTQDQIEKRLGCKADAIIERQLVELRKIYTSLKDNFGKISDYFETQKKFEPEEAQNVLKDKK